MCFSGNCKIKMKKWDEALGDHRYYLYAYARVARSLLALFVLGNAIYPIR